jgi:hypothetical protein
VRVEAAENDVRLFVLAAHEKPDVQQQAALRQAGLYRVKVQPEGEGPLPGQLVLASQGIVEAQADYLGLLERHRPEQAAVLDGVDDLLHGVLHAAHARRAWSPRGARDARQRGRRVEWGRGRSGRYDEQLQRAAAVVTPTSAEELRQGLIPGRGTGWTLCIRPVNAVGR